VSFAGKFVANKSRGCPSSYRPDIWNSEEFSDLKIVCGNDTFFCHKNILVTRSDVFAAMFDSKTEDEKIVVQVDDFDAKTMKTILAFIYCNDIDQRDVDIDVFLAAVKYNLPGLEECCKAWLI
jgi:speckle-type POZ protein